MLKKWITSGEVMTWRSLQLVQHARDRPGLDEHRISVEEQEVVAGGVFEGR